MMITPNNENNGITSQYYQLSLLEVTLIGKFIDIKQQVNDYYALVLLIKLSSLLRDFEWSSLFLSSLYSYTSTFILSTEYFLSVRESSLVSVCSFYAGFEEGVSSINGLCPVGTFSKCGGRFGYCWVIIMILSWFLIGSFLWG